MLARTTRFRTIRTCRTCLGAFALLGALTMIQVAAASAQTGGAVSPGDPTAPAPAPAPILTPAPTSGVATIAADGSAIPPAGAPPRVVRAIAAGNRIRTMPYKYGGGHAKFRDSGYDCSGAVSYVLKAARAIKRPMPSGPLSTSWGAPGPGSWITVYGKPSHAYMIVAGLRFDTSSGGDPVSQGTGPRWRTTIRPPTGFLARHFLGL